MNKIFTYSLLQYKHSLSLNEALNVGILFSFPEQQHLQFVAGNSHRVKAAYPDFEITTFNYFVKHIESKIHPNTSLHFGDLLRNGLSNYIQSEILNEDSTSLQFSEPVGVVNSFGSIDEAIKTYSSLLLPLLSSQIEKPVVKKRNEQFILKTYTNYIFEHHKELEKLVTRNETVTTKGLSLKFDIGWQNGSYNLVKPLSFDLADAQSIQTKAATYLGYLTQLESYAKQNKVRFDFLIAEPQIPGLKKDYENALDQLTELTKTPKQLVTEDRWQSYSETTIQELLKHK